MGNLSSEEVLPKGAGDVDDALKKLPEFFYERGKNDPVILGGGCVVPRVGSVKDKGGRSEINGVDS